MTPVWITVESNVFCQKMFERFQQRIIPVSRFQNGPKHFFETTILIARDARSPGHLIHCTNSGQIGFTNGLKSALPARLNGREPKGPSHELVVVHFLPDRRNSRPWREIAGIALAVVELL